MSTRAGRYAPIFAAVLLGWLTMTADGAPIFRPDAFGEAADWGAHAESLLEEPALQRYYVFETAAEDTVSDRAGAGEPLTYAEAGDSAPQRVEGRWPEREAFRVDGGRFSGELIPVEDRAFTASLWFRTQGMGQHRGNQGATNGTILANGVGYTNGWRVIITYPHQTVRLEIGAEDGPFGLNGGPISDGLWNHLAVTWDSETVTMYINGLKTAEGSYDGPYTEPDGQDFRVGYAGYGVGSVVLDVAELAVFDEALSPETLFHHAHFHAPREPEIATRMQEAHAQDGADAVAAYEAMLADEELDEHYREMALLQVAPLADWASPEIAADALRARAAIERAGELAGLDTLFSLGQRLQAAGETGEARAVYEEILEHPEVEAAERHDARLRMGHTYWQEEDYEQARATYRQLAGAEDVPFQYRANALSRIARTHVLEGEFETAIETYDALAEEAADADMPGGAHRHFEALAREQRESAARLAEGRAPWSPERTRTPLPNRPEPGLTLYVAPDGDDGAEGAEDAPLATFTGARDAIRDYRAAEGWPEGGVTVYFREGVYPFDEGVELTEQDSGEADAPIVYAAYPDEEPRFTGGVTVDGFEPVTDEAILSRLPEEARAHVVQANLPAQGITDLGSLEPRGFGQPGRPTPEVFFNGEPLELARWPNEGFVEAGDIIEQTDDEAVFTFEGDRPAEWAEPGKVWMFGYWYHHWADGTLAVAAIDGENQRITTDGLPSYGVREGQHYHYFNILEELERPGEWYLDRDTGMLYLYPPSDIEEATVEFSLLEDAMVTLNNTAHVWLDGLTLDVSRGSGVEINSGERNIVAGCTIGRMAQDGVEINGGTGHGVVGCDLFALGRGGTDVTGGHRVSLEPGEHFIENNEIRDFSRLDRTYTPAVWMRGAGNRIAHNLFHDAPHHAIRLDGNDHVVEFNEIHSVVYESDDQAGLDMWFNPAYRGNIIRYNFWHHIGSGLDRHGQSGVRLDDAISGVRVYGNVFLRSSGGNFGAIQIHGGKENVLDGNLFIECDAVLSFSAWSESRWLDFLERSNVVQALTETVNIHEPPYSERYPELADLETNPNMNFFWRNAAVKCRELLLRAPDNQLIMDNWAGAVDPGFTDPEARDFSLAEDAPLYGLTGMEPIPFGHIGPHDDEYRARWPIEHEVSDNYMALDPDN